MSKKKEVIEGVTGVTFGAFDLLHAGHVNFLKACQEYCDRLIVGLHVDPSTERTNKNKPVQSVLERFIQLDALECVDEVFVYETESDIDKILQTFDIKLRFLGSEYENTHYTAESTCIELGVEVVFIPRLHGWSTTELRDRIRNSK